MRSLLLDAAGTTSQPSVHEPHTLIFFVLALIGLGLAAASLWTKRDTSGQRRVFWTGVFGAGVSGFVACLPNWKMGVGMLFFLIVGMCIPAYFSTPFIKIGGKVRAFHIQDSDTDSAPTTGPENGTDDSDFDRHPDAYGTGVTATKAWWLMIVAYAIGALNVVFAIADHKLTWLTTVVVAALALVTAVLAYGDASWGYRVARGQYLQFVVIGILTAGVFTLIYCGAFAAGRQWPLRRKESLEYRAHPRHQKKTP